MTSVNVYLNNFYALIKVANKNAQIVNNIAYVIIGMMHVSPNISATQ